MLPYIAYMDPMGMAIIGDIPYCMFLDKGKKCQIFGFFFQPPRLAHWRSPWVFATVPGLGRLGDGVPGSWMIFHRENDAPKGI